MTPAYEAGARAMREAAAQAVKAVDRERDRTGDPFSWNTGRDLVEHEDRLDKIIAAIRALPLPTPPVEGEMAQAGEPKRWCLSLICCGHDEGQRFFVTWDEADQFRESWCTGPGVGKNGHDRSGIITDFNVPHPTARVAEGERSTLLSDMSAVLNRHSQENASDTPDFILARFLMDCLAAWNAASQQRERWYGRAAQAPPEE